MGRPQESALPVLRHKYEARVGQCEDFSEQETGQKPAAHMAAYGQYRPVGSRLIAGNPEPLGDSGERQPLSF